MFTRTKEPQNLYNIRSRELTSFSNFLDFTYYCIDYNTSVSIHQKSVYLLIPESLLQTPISDACVLPNLVVLDSQFQTA